MEILEPTSQLPNWLRLGEFQTVREIVTEDGRPNDEIQHAAQKIGRTNAMYDAVWDMARQHPDMWIPVRCNSMRRALLLASAGLQHRTLNLQVWRRGRVVCVKLVTPEVQGVNEHETVHA